MCGTSIERLAQVIRTSFKQPDAVVNATTVADVIGMEQVGDLMRMIDRKLAHASIT